MCCSWRRFYLFFKKKKFVLFCGGFFGKECCCMFEPTHMHTKLLHIRKHKIHASYTPKLSFEKITQAIEAHQKDHGLKVNAFFNFEHGHNQTHQQKRICSCIFMKRWTWNRICRFTESCGVLVRSLLRGKDMCQQKKWGVKKWASGFQTKNGPRNAHCLLLRCKKMVKSN